MKNKYNFVWVIAVVGICFFLGSGWIRIRTLGETYKTITVSGEDTYSVMPDKAEIYVYVLTENEDAATSENENTQTINLVIDAIETLGIDNTTIETSSYYLSPKTSWDEETGESEIYAYQVKHTLKITTSQIDEAGSIVTTCVSAGANGVSSVSFTLSDELEDEVYSIALANAGEMAQNKAENIADAMSAIIIGLNTLTESQTYYSAYRYSESSIMGYDSTSILPEEVEVYAYITAVYNIL